MSRVLLIKQFYIIDNRGPHVFTERGDTLHDLHRLVSNSAIYIYNTCIMFICKCLYMVGLSTNYRVKGNNFYSNV